MTTSTLNTPVATDLPQKAPALANETRIKNKVVFVQRELEDKLGPMTLVAYLKQQGFDTKIIIDPLKHLDELKRINPEFVALSVLSSSVTWTLKTCREIKKVLPYTRILLGGPHPTYFPEVVLEPEIDLICKGEGEKSMIQMLKLYDGTMASIANIPNFWVKDGDKVTKNELGNLLDNDELTALPPIDRSLYAEYKALRNNPHKKIWTSRGCPYSCSFCFNNAYNEMYKGKGKTVRQRSVDSVMHELRELKKYGWRTLEITDDLFLVNRDWVLEFCEKYEKEIRLPFTCFATANMIKEDVVKSLKSAGCSVISFGIESGVQEIRFKAHLKPITNVNIYKAAEVMHRHKLPFLTFNMVGLPDETYDDIFETVKINQEIETPYPWCSIVTPYPGTKIAEYMKEKANINLNRPFHYSYFEESILDDEGKRKMFSNAQKLFAYAVKKKISKDRFRELIYNPTARADRWLYPLIFYWNYGTDIRKRYHLSWLALFRYWLYTKGN